MKLRTIISLGAATGALLGLAPAVARAAAVEVTLTTVPGGLAITVDGTNYTAPAVLIWESDSAHTVSADSPQVPGDGHTRYSFVSWSNGGAQTNDLVVPATNTTYTAAFSTEYLLDFAIAPSGAGTVTALPSGPWYSPDQVVDLTANTNTGYRFHSWGGVDSAVSNTAQVTMTGYRLVQAGFIPSDYPYVIVTNSGGAAPGQLIGNIGGRNADGTKTHYVVLDNTGTNLIYASKTNTLSRFVTPQGFDVVSGSGGFNLKDETLNVVGTITTVGPAITLDTHDIEIWPNGHTLLFGQEFRTFDLSLVMPGGKTSANVTGDVIQEFDSNKRLVFEWHTFDHIAITNTFADMTQSSFDYAHINNVTIDPTDNNLLASLRTTSEIIKINRRTGEVMWRLGGKMNQFTFIDEHPENAPYYTVGQHDAHRLANGNLLYFDNGNISGGGVTPSDRAYSRMVEYALDEVTMTATLVWEYRHTPDISAGCTGSLKRMANGNTFIDWGCAVSGSGFIVTEVNPAGEIVFEMRHWTNSGISSVLLGGGLLKQLWDTPELIRSSTFQNVQSGQAYTSAVAGVSVTLNSLTGSVDNTLVAQRRLDAVRFPLFPGKAPQVVMEHIVLSGSNITTLEAALSLSLPDTSYVFDAPMIHDPAEVVVYHRPTVGLGEFTALPTTYDSGAQKLQATTTQLGEFVFGYPDVDETPYVPALVGPPDESEVNQASPVSLAWSPQGLVGSFDLQVATDAGFASLVVDTNEFGSNNYTLTNLAPNTEYFWRVRAVNQGGTSDWATASFTAVPPMLELTYPAGGEVWQRFQVVTIQWNDNLSENVALDMYKGGVSNRTFAANIASSGSYTWTVGQFQAFAPGSDYTIKIRSRSDPNLFDFSEPFSIVQPVIVTTVPTGLVVRVDSTNYTAPASFAWTPDSSHNIETDSPQISGDGHSRYLFSSWSDGGAQSHSITALITGATNTARFSTNYLLDATATPAGAGTVTAEPTGPWYDAGQLVSLTAHTSDGYLFYDWEGVASKAGNTAQLTMNGYRAAQAKFIPVNGVPLIDAASFTRLPDGRVQFNLTAGAGVATRATVWGTTTLSPVDWQILGTVPLTNGIGVFIEDPAPTSPARFYRVSLP